MSANKPNRHHFLPVFYLRQWAGADQKIVRFTRPYGDVVKPLRVHPDGAGYIEHLYAAQGLPDEARQDLETDFLSPVDSRAADALKALLAGNVLTQAQRNAWAGFIATLLFRMPNDITKFKENISQIWQMLIPGFEKIYNALPAQDQAGSFEEFFNGASKDILAGKAIEAARKLMGDEDVVRSLAALEWSVLTTDNAKHELLTSDRPVAHSYSLHHPESHLFVPIGPSRVFLAVRDRSLIAKIKAEGADKLVRVLNDFVVSNATVTVCGRTDSQLQFIQRRMGIETQPSLVSRLPEMQSAILADVMAVWESQSTLFAQALPEKLKGLERGGKS
ncbi:MAG: DUF4238 domain-containing protein [Mesorhizobium sp.]|uniref:DUF4238 domain-containing protein n=1 Tax=unclassified Mesorhizobium TaxID=325217 RepID=UPI000F75C8F0|nr:MULTISPECIES: DUF4238 domain-containing protein [unclassified Mesorhizobium]AZO35480.1 DUF4238 domain-containing protein [Mesorhizobium sp. M2A.F.Ca.ET.046.03.2.1]RVC78074.1 DUF4238 domain-containing protein [Mesorhizobium sp. M2A.F.Ca.ET.046.02.1.1]RWB45856.1 MAG: DUF4238 domain-containing protein [Mesorhizobium sp.]RWE19471.1 MAG: DUF4238 domain-containing protein [Mesorhizobium sp.]